MSPRRLILQHPGAFALALTLAASDVAYRLLIRGPLRRALGLTHYHATDGRG
jgi:hypothetical protein